MRAQSMLLPIALTALVGGVGCVSSYAGDYGYDRPIYGSAYDYGDYQHVYNAGLGVYTVVGYPNVYFHDGWYWRHYHGHWQRCARPYGGTWSHIAPHYVPRRLHSHYGGHQGNRGHHDRVDRRHDRRDWRHDRQDRRHEARHDRRDARRDHRDEHREARHERRDHRQEARHERRDHRQDVRQDRRDQRHEVRHERRDARREHRADHRAQKHERREERKQQRHEGLAGPVH